MGFVLTQFNVLRAYQCICNICACVCVCVPWAMFSSAKSSNWKESVGWSSRPIADFMLESFWVLSGPNS